MKSALNKKPYINFSGFSRVYTLLIVSGLLLVSWTLFNYGQLTLAQQFDLQTNTNFVPDERNCEMATGIKAPAPINLSLSSSGLTVTKNQPIYYTVYGNSPVQILAEIRHCAPKQEGAHTTDNFAAFSNYALSADYTWQLNEQGSCTVTNTKVGLHLQTILPNWQPDQSATPSLKLSWQKYINSLQIHEAGHEAIAEQYARTLAAKLTNYQASCATMPKDLEALVSQTNNQIGSANITYDMQTSHGLTQGVLLK